MSFSFSSLVSVDSYHLLCSLFLIFKPNFDYCFKSTVHLRLRPMDQNNPKTLFPSTSAVTYWQIELQTGPIDGMSNFVCMYFYWKAFTEPEKWAAVRICWLYQFCLFLWFFNRILELFQKCGIFVFQFINSAVLQSKNYYHMYIRHKDIFILLLIVRSQICRWTYFLLLFNLYFKEMGKVFNQIHQ